MPYTEPHDEGRRYSEGTPYIEGKGRPRAPHPNQSQHTSSLDEPLDRPIGGEFGDTTQQRPQYWSETSRGGDLNSTSPSTSKMKGTKKLSHRFANKTSLQGIKFIEDATNWGARSFWIILFVGGLGASVYQLYGVFSTYFAYKVTTKIDLGYDTLNFPSVSICNVNPLRYPSLNLAPEMKRYIDSLSTNWNDQPTQDQGQDQGQSQGRPRKRGLFPDFDGDEGFSGDYGHSNYQYDTNEAFGSQTESDSYIMQAKFYDLLRTIKPEDRAVMGHQGNLTILACSFNGYTCSQGDFSQFLTTEYGNCYQFNSNQLRNSAYQSRTAGLNHGLDVVLYTGYREYLPGYTYGTGFRVAIHPFKTMALPNQYSMAVSPGFETNIAMKMVNISRMGSPHGSCSSTDIYLTDYGVTYTTAACSSTCIDRYIATKCNCMRMEYTQYYPRRYYDVMGPCKTTQDVACVGSVINDVENGRIVCNCNQPCKETTYETTPSFLAWPNTAVLGNMIDMVCLADEVGEDCDYLVRGLDMDGLSHHDLLRENFARVKIYFQELNFETITEEAAYDKAQFGADIGGVVGLWLGMSVLSVFEVLHFAAQLICHCCRRGVGAGSRQAPRPPGLRDKFGNRKQ